MTRSGRALPVVALAALVTFAGCAGPTATSAPNLPGPTSTAGATGGTTATPNLGQAAGPTATPNASPTPSAAPPNATPGPLPGPDPAAAALADRLRQSAYTTDTTAAAVEALARSGIATYATPDATAPEVSLTGAASGLRLLDFQVHALAVDAWRGKGLSAAQLDATMPIPDAIHDQTAPASAFLAGYVASVDSPGAALARSLMAGQDLSHPTGLHVPAMVLDLFVADLATDGGQHPAANPTGAAFPVVEAMLMRPGTPVTTTTGQAGLATLCSDSSAFIDQTIHSLFDALKVAVPDNTVGAIVATIWNWIVDQGEAFVHTLMKAVTGAVLKTVRFIAGSIATIAELVASLVPYVVSVAVDPGSPIVLGQSRVNGSLIATVSGGDLPKWPDIMQDCAKSAQVPLPSFRGRDEHVTWGNPTTDANGLVSPLRADTVSDQNGEAHWYFVTSTDPGADPGAVLNAGFNLDVTVHRAELEQAQNAISDALFGGIPGILRTFVDELFSGFIKPLKDRIAQLIDTTATGSLEVQYHDTPPATPTPVVTPPPASIEGTWHGSWSSNSFPGLAGGFVVKFHQTGTDLTGTIAISGTGCIAGGSITGSLFGGRIKFGSVRGAETIAYSGIFSGTGMSGSWAVTEPSGGECINDSGPWEASR